MNDFAQFLDEQREKFGVPGVSVGVIYQGERQLTTAGVTNMDHPLPVTPDTLFQIGSITKTMTATVLQRLAQTGKIDLSARVGDYLPDFCVADATATAVVTVQDLLTHASGWIGDFFKDTGNGADAKQRYLALMADLPQLVPFGTHFSYNNAAFTVAGALVEQVTGRPYEEVMQEMLFEPLGMNNSFFDPGDVMVRRFAVGHRAGEAGAKVAVPWPLPRYAASMGGVVASVPDLLTYARFYLDKGVTAAGDRLLPLAAMVDLWTPRLPSDRSTQVCLSWFIHSSFGADLYRHGGGTVGQIAELSILPEHDLAFAILTNGENGGQLVQAIEDKLLAHILGLSRPEAKAVATDSVKLAEFVGQYKRPSVTLDLELVDGQLTMRQTFLQPFPSEDAPLSPPAPPVTVGLLANGDLLILDGAQKGRQLQVLRQADGTIGWLRNSSRLHPRV